MTIYVAEIDGIPLAAFQAETYDNAREIVNADWFRADLPWDGEAEISIREAIRR